MLLLSFWIASCGVLRGFASLPRLTLTLVSFLLNGPLFSLPHSAHHAQDIPAPLALNWTGTSYHHPILKYVNRTSALSCQKNLVLLPLFVPGLL
jgi:hypothetical protein